MMPVSRALPVSTLVLLTALLAANLVIQQCQNAPRPAAFDEAGGQEATARPASTVLLLSLDGFRADYLDRYEAPALQRLAAEGVRAQGMLPSFPSKTFPNHYTLVTGLYAEHHGIVSNTMYDPEFDASFSMGNREAVRDGRWWGGEPLWVTLEKKGLKSAPFFWPGSEAEIRGVRPSYWLPFDGSMPPDARITQVMDWLALPEAERPVFITLYFSDVDGAGHAHGPDSEEVAGAIRDVDAYIGSLVDQLKARALYDRVNLIIVADHGMAASSPDRVVFLDDYFDLDDVRVVDYDPVAMLRPAEGKREAVYDALQRAPHLTIYKKEDVPEDLHFTAHRRITPLVALAEDGWRISTHAFYDRDPNRFAGGAHGYDHRLPSMHALFIARGPAFAVGKTVGPFANIHLYNLMAALLGVEPAPNDGDLNAVRHILKPGIAVP